MQERGIRSIETKEIKGETARTVKDKLLSDTSHADDMTAKAISARPIYPSVMRKIFEEEGLLEAIERRLKKHGLDDLITYYDCGEDSLVFHMGSPGDSVYLVRLAPAYNKSFDIETNDIPAPMIRPVYHEVINSPVSEEGVRFMIVPRLRPFRVPNRSPFMRANKAAMKQLGYNMDDEGCQNFMYIEGDENFTPICIDFGVYSKPKNSARSAFSSSNSPASSSDYKWKGLQEAHFPIHNINDAKERLEIAKEQAFHELPLCEVQEKKSENDHNVRIFE